MESGTSLPEGRNPLMYLPAFRMPDELVPSPSPPSVQQLYDREPSVDVQQYSPIPGPNTRLASSDSEAGPAADPGPSMEMSFIVDVPSASSSRQQMPPMMAVQGDKQKKARRGGRTCVSCDAAGCEHAKTCGGRGGHYYCTCRHPQPKNSRSRKK